MGRFASEVTEEEIVFGFRLVEHDGTKKVVVMLAPGVSCVKVLARSGAPEYAICDDDLRPLYVAATSLDELRKRYHR